MHKLLKLCHDTLIRICGILRSFHTNVQFFFTWHKLIAVQFECLKLHKTIQELADRFARCNFRWEKRKSKSLDMHACQSHRKIFYIELHTTRAKLPKYFASNGWHAPNIIQMEWKYVVWIVLEFDFFPLYLCECDVLAGIPLDISVYNISIYLSFTFGPGR